MVGSRDTAVTPLIEALAHEAGNLMAAIRLSAHLQRVEKSEEARDALSGDIASLATQCGALLALVSPLLEPEAGERARLEPRDVLRGLSAAFEDRAASDVALAVRRPVAGLPALRARPEPLHHVLVSLVAAALEASRPKGRVRVEAGVTGSRVWFAVEDRGRACDLEELEREAPRGARELLLRVARAVLERDRGRLVVASDARRTRAELRFPALRARSR